MFLRLIAWLILTTNIDVPTPPENVRKAFIELAVELELIHEKHYMLNNDTPYDGYQYPYISLIRERYHELKNAPPLKDRERFRYLESITRDTNTWGYKLKEVVRIRQIMEPHNYDVLQNVYEDLSERMQLWTSVQTVLESEDPGVVRERLLFLKDALDDVGFASGILPEPYPPLAFRYAD